MSGTLEQTTADPPAVSAAATPAGDAYAAGAYFEDSGRHSEDAEFKAENFLKLLAEHVHPSSVALRNYVDVGCGSGDVARIIDSRLREFGYSDLVTKGYDVSPHVKELYDQRVEYLQGDFGEADEDVDLVTLFDVFEHVPDTIEFLKNVAHRTKLVGFHIPLDSSFNVLARDLPRKKLRNPGHLVCLDVASALNTLAYAGLRVVDYRYTFGFLAPSGRSTLLGKLILPVRYALAKCCPWLLSKTFGGVSLAVLALTPKGMQEYDLGV